VVPGGPKFAHSDIPVERAPCDASTALEAAVRTELQARQGSLERPTRPAEVYLEHPSQTTGPTAPAMGPVDASGRSREDQLVYVGEGEGDGVGGQVMTKLMSLSRVTVIGPVYEVITLPALM
jgi:hypothetical protein